jgi:hypothetical protein
MQRGRPPATTVVSLVAKSKNRPARRFDAPAGRDEEKAITRHYNHVNRGYARSPSWLMLVRVYALFSTAHVGRRFTPGRLYWLACPTRFCCGLAY